MFKALRKRLFSLNGDERGFTIVELLVVITIVGILAGVGVSGYQRFQERAYATAADAAWRDLQVAISLYEAEEGDRFPRYVWDGAGAATAPEDDPTDAVASQLIPPPEPLETDLWEEEGAAPEGRTGFVAVQTDAVPDEDTQFFTCVYVKGTASRFNDDLCRPVRPQ